MARKKKQAQKRVSGKPQKKGPARKRSPAAEGRAPTALGRLSLKEIAAAVSSVLSQNGHDPLLGGRACAALYGGSAIKAKALEFAIREFAVAEVNRAMGALGFRPKEARTYASEACPFEVILGPSPLTVGDDVVGDARVVKVGKDSFRMLTPTDCVRQRLSMFYRWGDRQALAEAVQVARRQKIDLEHVRRWSEWEWASDRFQEFTEALEKGL